MNKSPLALFKNAFLVFAIAFLPSLLHGYQTSKNCTPDFIDKDTVRNEIKYAAYEAFDFESLGVVSQQSVQELVTSLINDSFAQEPSWKGYPKWHTIHKSLFKIVEWLKTRSIDIAQTYGNLNSKKLNGTLLPAQTQNQIAQCIGNIIKKEMLDLLKIKPTLNAPYDITFNRGVLKNYIGAALHDKVRNICARILTFECPACLEENADSIFECGHSMCGACYQDHQAKKIQSKSVVDCPECRRPIDNSTVQKINLSWAQ